MWSAVRPTPRRRSDPKPHPRRFAPWTGPALARARFSDLISNWNNITQQVELSLPKAQMVVWTVIVLAVFIVKSFLLGALWPVPWELVALTGFSQAGYVGDKFVQSDLGKTVQFLADQDRAAGSDRI